MTEPDPSASARIDIDGWRAAGPQLLRHRSLLPAPSRAPPRRALRPLRGPAAPVADAAGSELDALVAEANRDENLPTLRRHDAEGRPIEEVIFHPAGHAVASCSGRAACSRCSASPATRPRAARSPTCSTTTARPATPARWRAPRAPSSCCSGSAPTTSAGDTCPAWLEADYRRRLLAAQFVTEVQGGSDVGSNSCRAVPEPGARAGTDLRREVVLLGRGRRPVRGQRARRRRRRRHPRLGLFLVPRLLDGRPNGFAFRRLKTKLGTGRWRPARSSSRTPRRGDRPAGDGFRNLVGIVLDTSRVHNAVAAAG